MRMRTLTCEGGDVLCTTSKKLMLDVTNTTMKGIEKRDGIDRRSDGILNSPKTNITTNERVKELIFVEIDNEI